MPHRYFTTLIEGDTARLEGPDAHHLGRVMRAKVGQQVILCDGAGTDYTAAITAGSNLSVFSASYYHRVNPQVEAGAKATWDSKSGNSVGLEVASKYRLDPSSFAKVC